MGTLKNKGKSMTKKPAKLDEDAVEPDFGDAPFERQGRASKSPVAESLERNDVVATDDVDAAIEVAAASTIATIREGVVALEASFYELGSNPDRVMVDGSAGTSVRKVIDIYCARCDRNVESFTVNHETHTVDVFCHGEVAELAAGSTAKMRAGEQIRAFASGVVKPFVAQEPELAIPKMPKD